MWALEKEIVFFLKKKNTSHSSLQDLWSPVFRWVKTSSESRPVSSRMTSSREKKSWAHDAGAPLYLCTWIHTVNKSPENTNMTAHQPRWMVTSNKHREVGKSEPPSTELNVLFCYEIAVSSNSCWPGGNLWKHLWLQNKFTDTSVALWDDDDMVKMYFSWQ